MVWCANVYIAEISTPYHRGPLIAVILLAANIGYIFSFLILQKRDLWGNKIPLIFLVIWSLYFCLTLLIPESPIWLYSKGRHKESIDSLNKIRRADREEIDAEITEIKAFCGTPTANPTVFELVKNCFKTWRSFAIITILLIMIENTGYRVFGRHIKLLLDQLDMPYSESITNTYNLPLILGSLIAPFMMYFVNVNIMLSVASFGMGICLLVLSIFGNYSWILNTCIGVYAFLSIFGVYPIIYIMAAEVFPQNVNGIMNSSIILLNNMFFLAYMKMCPQLFAYIGANMTMWISCISCFILSIYVIFILPSTRGKTLNEIQEIYFRKKDKYRSRRK